MRVRKVVSVRDGHDRSPVSGVGGMSAELWWWWWWRWWWKYAVMVWCAAHGARCSLKGAAVGKGGKSTRCHS